jgi:hypothetical protein
MLSLITMTLLLTEAAVAHVCCLPPLMMPLHGVLAASRSLGAPLPLLSLLSDSCACSLCACCRWYGAASPPGTAQLEDPAAQFDVDGSPLQAARPHLLRPRKVSVARRKSIAQLRLSGSLGPLLRRELFLGGPSRTAIECR